VVEADRRTTLIMTLFEELADLHTAAEPTTRMSETATHFTNGRQSPGWALSLLIGGGRAC
jgi:hypothetical protein